MVTGDDGGVVTGAGGGVVTGAGGGVVTGAGGGLVTGAGGGLVTGAGGGLVTGSGGGVLCSAGGGGFVADSPGSGAVVAGGTAAVGVGNGDGWGASVAPPGDGPGSAGVVPTGAGVPPALSPVRAAWDWLALACAGVMPGGSGGMTRSGRPGPPTSPPVAAGTVMVTAAPGRAWTRPRRFALPQPQRHPRRRHRHRRHRGQQPRRQQPPEPVPVGLPDAGLAPAGLPDAGPAPAGRARRGGEPVAERIRLAGRPPPAGLGIGRGHGRRGPERHGSRSNPRRARPAAAPSWWHSVRAARRTVTVTHRQMTPSCAGATHARMPPMRGKAR